MKRRRPTLAPAFAILFFFFPCVVWAAPPVPATAAVHTYVIAIGYNDGAPDTLAGGAGRPPTLRFADDDAAAFYGFIRPFSSYGTLLTIADPESQRRFPDLLAQARSPSLVELRRAVGQIKERIESDRRAGIDAVVLFFYSGHGTLGDPGPPFLAMTDGALTREVLYDEILADLPARYVHLFIDACHAEAVVRQRDTRAAIVDLTGADVTAYAEHATLARFPNVGVVVASTSTAVAHEWDVYRGGIFTHEVLSGLRGGADINGDQRVEYSELSAFIGAANREVADPEARLRAVVVPPRINPRTPLVDLRGAPQAGRLYGTPAGLGGLHIEDQNGQRLVDLRAAAGFQVTLTVPAGRTLFVRHGDDEAEVRLRPGQALAFEQLAFHPMTTRERSALTSSLRAGLFATPFGPVYYLGFTDRSDEVVAVPMALAGGAVPELVIDRPPQEAAGGASASPTWLWFGSAGVLAVAGGVFAALTYRAYSDFRGTTLQVDADQANDRFHDYGLASVALFGTAAVTAAVGTYFWWHGRSGERSTRGLSAVLGSKTNP